MKDRLVADRKPFLLRVDPAVFKAVQRWADDDLRSLNGQIEWILRWALTEARRGKFERPPGATLTKDDRSRDKT